MSAGLKWTGHPLVDVGIAGVCAFAKQGAPQDVSLEQLDSVSEYLAETYYQEKLGTYLTCVFMNASFVQPKEGPEKRKQFFERYLRAHRATPDPIVAGQRCVFSGLSATSPMVRTQLPLFSGEDVLNFRPNGTASVPVAGPYIVAIFFLPLASRRSEGKLLCVHPESPDLLLRFARRHLERNQRLISLALPTQKALTHENYDRELPMWDGSKKRYKFADAKGPRSLVVADLSEIGGHTSDVDPDVSPLTAYLLSSSGQGPSLEIFDLPSGVVSFVLKAAGATTSQAWKSITMKFRPVRGGGEEDGEEIRTSSKKGASGPEGRPGWSKNPAFEDLCAIYENGFTDRHVARRWLSRYVLGRIRPDVAGSRFEPSNARTWALAELFLKEVLSMKQARIAAIRAFADKLAARIQSSNDKALYRSLLQDKANDLRRALLRAQRNSVSSGKVLFGLDEYATVWLHEDGDEWLVRDLICIRVTETLAQAGYFKTNADVLPEEIDANEEVPR